MKKLFKFASGGLLKNKRVAGSFGKLIKRRFYFSQNSFSADFGLSRGNYADFCIMIKSQNLFFKKRDMFVRNRGINNNFVILVAKRHFQGKIIFLFVIPALSDGLHPGIKLLHRADKFLKVF